MTARPPPSPEPDSSSQRAVAVAAARPAGPLAVTGKLRPRVLVFLPSWLGDTVMATPTLMMLRRALPGSIIVGLVRPGIDELLAGDEESHTLDDVIVADRTTLLGPAKTASRLVPQKFDVSLLLPNSFSAAMTVRLAGIPLRVGYDRDGRGLLLTHSLEAPLRQPPHKGWAPISAVDYYFQAGRRMLGVLGVAESLIPESPGPLVLHCSAKQAILGDEILSRAGIDDGTPFAILNPGGNNPAKRWPVERFAALAHHLITERKMAVVINGSPGEAPLAALIRQTIALNHPGDEAMVSSLPEMGITVGSLKRVVQRSRLMITNDTGPRHLAAAFGVPCISLFGPTDPRWTTLPRMLTPSGRERETVLAADPTLPPELLADEVPDRCRITRISTETVIAAVDAALT